MPEAEEIEKIYVIPLKRKGVRTCRARSAIKTIKTFIARHMRTTEDNVWIDSHVNDIIWKRGIQKNPQYLKVKATKFEDELVEVSLPEK